MNPTLDRFDHRGHDVKISKEDDGVVVRIFAKSKLVFKEVYEELDEAREAGKEWVANAIVERVATRGEGNPTTEEYVQALGNALLNGHAKQRVMLAAHYKAEGHTITTVDLAKAVGYATYSPANLHYGKLGAYVRDELGLTLDKRKEGTDILASAIAECPDKTGPEQKWRWVMRPEVVEAVELLGIAKDNAS